MNKRIFLLFLYLLLCVCVYSISFDREIGVISSHLETYPFYLEFYDMSSILRYDFNNTNLLDNTFYKIDKDYYDRSFNIYVKDKGINKSFLIREELNDLYYGINFINDIYINNIYVSFHGTDKNTYFDLMSYFYMGNNTFYKYNTIIKLKYSNVFIMGKLKQDSKELNIGFQNNVLFSGVGGDSYKNINHFFVYKYKGVNFLIENSYNYNTHIFNKDYVFNYEYRNGRYTVMPVLAYNNDTIVMAMGMLFRHFSFLSYFINAKTINTVFDTMDNISNEGSIGMRFMNRSIMYNMAVNYNSIQGFNYAASILLKYKYLKFGIIADYSDSIEYKVNLSAGIGLFNDNLIVNGELFLTDNIGTYINIKLIDAYLFGGVDWYMKEELYNVRWGLQWYFSE